MRAMWFLGGGGAGYLYSAPSGGVLAAINLQVLASQSGQSSLYVDLDDRIPQAPGSEVVVFTGGGTTVIEPSELSLGDSFHGEGVNCIPVAIAAMPTPTSPPVPTPPAPESSSAGDSAGGDTETAGEIDAHCDVDVNGDTLIDIRDLSLVAGAFGDAGPPEYDIEPDFGDGDVDISDISKVAGAFNHQCFGVSGMESLGAAEASAMGVPLSVSGCQHLGTVWYHRHVGGGQIELGGFPGDG